MKKNSLILVFILFVALTASTCKKKRYPKDIPKWLKEKIEQLEKASKGKGCTGVCKTIEEYSDGSSTYYWITVDYNPTTYDVYNYDGQVICADTYSYGSGGCYTTGYNKNFIRLIWQEN